MYDFSKEITTSDLLKFYKPFVNDSRVWVHWIDDSSCFIVIDKPNNISEITLKIVDTINRFKAMTFEEYEKTIKIAKSPKKMEVDDNDDNSRISRKRPMQEPSIISSKFS